MTCTAHTTKGAACKAKAMAGAKVCRVHGGSAPQVIAAARRRILAAADPVAARLVQIALSKKVKPETAAAACRDLLNRAGLVSHSEEPAAAGDGQVLWDEFIQIHRRRVSGETDPSA